MIQYLQLNLLFELFKSDDSAIVKLRTLKETYDINLTQSEEGMVDTMCNLSVGVFERGWDTRNKEIIVNLLKKNMDMKFIIDVVDCPVSFVRQVAKEENLPVKE